MSEKKFGDRLKQLRENANLSLADVANACASTASTIRRWENSESLPDIDKAILLAQCFGISVYEMLGVDSPIEQQVKAAIEIKEEKLHRAIESIRDIIKDHPRPFSGCPQSLFLKLSKISDKRFWEKIEIAVEAFEETDNEIKDKKTKQIA